MLEKLKGLFKKKNEVEEIDLNERKRREQLNAELNHPDDNFVDDEFLEEEEMRIMSEKSRKRGNFKTGYYAFGFLFAAAIIIYALVNIFKDSKFDLRIMVQDDGFITEAELADIEELITPHVPDKNGDGEIKIEVISISMPAERNEGNESIYLTAVDKISEELVPYYVSVVFGREDFIEEVNNIRPLKDKVLLENVNNFEIGEESSLKEYYIAVRETVQDADKYSPVGIDIFNAITE